MAGLLGGMQRFAQGVNGLLFPGFAGAGVDPEAVRRAQAQAMLQTGMGLLGGQDVGKAYGLGQASGWEPIEQARREAVMRAAAQDRQAEAEWRKAQQERQTKLDQRDIVNDNRTRMYRRFDKQTADERWQKEFDADEAYRKSSLSMRTGGNQTPAAVQTAQWYAKASPEEREAFDRANGTTGGAQGGQPMADTRTPNKVNDAQNVKQSIRVARDLVSPWAAGFVGQKMRDQGGTPAFDLAKAVDTIKANIGFDRLQRMREESKTGGALGQVAVQELEMLQSTIASLDTAQSPKQLLSNLDRVEAQYDRAIAAYEAAMGQVQPGAAPMQGSSGRPPLDTFWQAPGGQ